MDLLKDLKARRLQGGLHEAEVPRDHVCPNMTSMIMKQMKDRGGDGRPTSSVVRTISE